MTHARGTDAPEQRTEALDRALLRVEREISTHARALNEEADEVGHHLGRALRLHVPSAPPQTGTADHDRLDEARAYWLELAAHEHSPQPSRLTAICKPRAISPASRHSTPRSPRLPPRSYARHACWSGLRTSVTQEAWKAQSTSLSRAREMYTNGLPGASDALQRAQGILLTRLVRATVAITLIDLRSQSPASNMPCEQNE